MQRCGVCKRTPVPIYRSVCPDCAFLLDMVKASVVLLLIGLIFLYFIP